MNVILTLKHSQITFTFFSFRCNLLVKEIPKTLYAQSGGGHACYISLVGSIGASADTIKDRNKLQKSRLSEPLHNVSAFDFLRAFWVFFNAFLAFWGLFKGFLSVFQCFLGFLGLFGGLFECFSMLFWAFWDFSGAFWAFFNAFSGFLGLFKGFFECFFDFCLKLFAFILATVSKIKLFPFLWEQRISSRCIFFPLPLSVWSAAFSGISAFCRSCFGFCRLVGQSEGRTERDLCKNHRWAFHHGMDRNK